jgi:ATP-dependent DNA helicase RecQ
MDDRFAFLQEIVLGRAPLPEDVTDFRESTHQRLLMGLQGPTRLGLSDIAGLVRQVLRREEAQQGGVPQEWWVPKAIGWPSAEQWTSADVEIRSDLEDRFRVRANAWVPTWLLGAESAPPCEPVEAREERRNFAPVVGDPWLSVVNLETYRCGAQREMLRNVLTAPAGATLLCNLPTGAGKSFLAQLPALLRSRREGLSVVVVPTTALAMDQERSISGLVPHPTAYHPGSLSDGSDRREEIRRRILDGTQRIVFTSPESVIGGLSEILYAAAERGLLRFFAIDEAHIVLEWGNEFRSSFQELAGLRRDLLRNCVGEAFITLLMSATVSQECLRTLETLFADPGPFAVSSAVQLRPEPSYWASHCENEETREARVLEAVHRLPRPLILYTTKRKDADRWYQLLREGGYRRCAMVTGNTRTEERQEVVRRWKAADLDIVVATAAFGLGVDQGDVRAIVHACVPESIDRFYQEVGRGGRDGKASLSLVLYTDQDLGVARRMSRKKLIGPKKGPRRWERMFYHKEVKQVDEGLYRVPVGISPGVTATKIDMVNARNLAWNINTLTLLSRAGVLQMDAERPPPRDADGLDTDEEKPRYHERLESHREHRVIRILDPRHLELETWQKCVEPVRREAYRNSQLDVSRMHGVLQGLRCVAQILAEAYRIQTPGSGQVHVVPSCGGCSACRSRGQLPYAGPLPEPPPTWSISRKMGSPLARLFADSDAIAIFYDEVEQYDFERFLRWLVSMGIRSAVLPSGLPSSLRSVALEVLGAPMERPVFVSDAYHFRKAPRVPTLILHPNGIEVPTRYLPSTDGSGIPRVLFLPTEAMDPNGPHRRLRDVLPRKFGFSEFLLSQGL